MKIKTKKQLNLPQLIEWAWDNPELSRNKDFFDEDGGAMVGFDQDGSFETNFYINSTDLFTVSTVEEITEDTVIPKMLEMYRAATSNLGAEIHINQSINSVIENAEVLTLHIINDDGTHTLIWTKERGLLE